MANSKGVTLPQKIWWKQLVIRMLNRILGLSKIFSWNFVKTVLLQFLCVALIFLPVAIVGFNYFENAKLIVSPLLLMCCLSGVICYRVLDKDI